MSEEFYILMQIIQDVINRNNNMMVGGALNARVGSILMERILGQHNKSVCNVNGRMLQDFASFNGLRIVNIFF